MNLHAPLVLTFARTEDLSMVPTKEFFKPVLVVKAPLSKENALLLGCDYLFDPAGNPHHFEGTHKLEGDLSGAHLRLAGAGITEPVELKTEQVAHFGAFREEKKGMKVQLRAHLPELGEADLVRLFRFLSTLNKDGYTLTITDAQASLVGQFTKEPSGGGKDDPNHVWPQPDKKGTYSIDQASMRPFAAKKLKASVITVQVSEGIFLAGFDLHASFKDAVVARGVLPNSRDIELCPHSSAVIAAAAGAAMLKDALTEVKPSNDVETKAVSDLEDFINDLLDQGDAQ